MRPKRPPEGVERPDPPPPPPPRSSPEVVLTKLHKFEDMPEELRKRWKESNGPTQ